jgi:hypothetical protein
MGNFGASKVFRGIAFICTISALSALGSGCDEPDSFQSLGPITAPSPQSTLGNTNYVLQNFQPALAVRGVECMLCHGQVSSSIITDFGYGDPQYFVNQTAIESAWPGNDQVSNNNPLTVPWYGNYFGSWELAQITGTIVVPRATISDARTLTALGQSSPITMAQMLQISTPANFYSNGDASQVQYVGQGSMTNTVTPLTGNPKVVEIDEMYIGAPTVDQISGLTTSPGNTTTGFQAIAGSSITGLSVQSGTGGSYVTNTGVLNCTGDVVVTGTLFLNNPQINTDNNGCRLMVTQTAFLQGQVYYTSTTGTQNLQISSARGIMMGFDVSTLINRLQTTDKYPDGQPLTRYAGTNTEKNAAIVAEAQVIGAALHDSTDAADCPTQMVAYVAQDDGFNPTLTQCSINFQRLLINAPDIQSRYVGQFKGVVIAEIALFAPGALNFAYDPTFNDVPILPLLPPLLNVPGLTPPSSGCTGPLCGGGVVGI